LLSVADGKLRTPNPWKFDLYKLIWTYFQDKTRALQSGEKKKHVCFTTNSYHSFQLLSQSIMVWAQLWATTRGKRGTSDPVANVINLGSKNLWFSHMGLSENRIESLTLNFDGSKMLKLMFPVKIVIWVVIVHCQTLPYQVLGWRSMVRSENWSHRDTWGRILT